MMKRIQHIVLVLLLIIGMQSFAQTNDKETVSFGGHVFTEFFPIEYGKAIIYDENQQALDTAIIDTLGYYIFYKKPQGTYFIQAQLELSDPYFGSFYPTFYPNVFYENPKPVEILMDNWELDIYLYYFDELSAFGPGTIKGKIVLGENKLEIEGIDVQIHNDQGLPIRHHQTDRFGNFEMSNLPYGHYSLLPQVLGYTTVPLYFEISDATSEYSDIQMIIKNGTISSFINEAIVLDHSFQCFPNPAHHTLNLSFDFNGSHQIQTRVMDISGRVILETANEHTVDQFNTQLSTINWNNGFYFVEVFVGDTKAISQKVAVLH